MQKPLLPHVLRLEQAFEETVKAGTELPDSLRTAASTMRLRTAENISELVFE